MTYPYLIMDLGKIERNARKIVDLCREKGIEVTGVTKAVCGNPDVARAMMSGGVASIADSRLENIERLKGAGIEAPLMLLRLPPLSGVGEVVTSVESSLNSELAVLNGLSEAALRHDTVHEVILMLDLGDLREGIWPDELIPLVNEAVSYPGVRITGLGTNLACFSGVVPTEEIMNRLVTHAEEIEHRFHIHLERISGINSSGLELVASGCMPSRVNHARIGEAILLGRETIHRRPWPDTYQDAFVLYGEVLELKVKPSAPIGERSEDAFGGRPAFNQQGDILRALVNIGREDVDVDGIQPLDTRLRIIGASSGYLALDVTLADEDIEVGDELTFSLNYSALLAAMTSEYVKKRPLRPAES